MVVYWNPKKIDKVVLISLPDEGKVADYFTPKYAIESLINYPPLGLLYVATGIKDHYPVVLIDALAKKLGIEGTVKAIIEQEPGVLGISCQTFYVYPMLAIMEQVKKALPNITIIVGGPHIMAYPEETLELEPVDYCIEGDGDFSFKKLLDCINNNNKEGLKDVAGLIYYNDNGDTEKNPPDNLNLDDVPFPDRDLLGDHKYYTAADGDEQLVTMVSSRGCPFKCVYCDVLEKKYRTRSPKNIADEMEYIAKKYNNPIIHVFDDTFNLWKKRVMEICEEITSRKIKVRWTSRTRTRPLDEEMVVAMKDAGVVRLHFGVESGSELTLRKIKKGLVKKDILKAFELCEKYDIQSLAYFIIGFDWEAKHEINETIDFVRNIRPTYIWVNMLYPLGKTESYRQVLESGRLEEDFWTNYSKNPARNAKMPDFLDKKSKIYLKRKMDEMFINFYLSPKFIFRSFLKKNNYGGTEASLYFKINMAIMVLYSYINHYIQEILTTGENEFLKDKRDIDERPKKIK